jgi:hypothetical protein
MIRGNPPLQEGFAGLQVRNMVAQVTNGTTSPKSASTVYVIEALLDLAISPAATELFEARYAACECIKSYFYNHLQIRMHFLNRAIEGHISGQDETANALTTLISGSQGSQTIDPYRTWFAATLILHLVSEDHDAKNLLMKVAEGDAEKGEEVVTCIQTLTGNLIASFQLGEDERISIGYLMLLSTWLFEDAAAVNDFLGEASSVQSLVQTAQKPGNDNTVIKGLCAVLLGIIYEFSTKDSPIPRRDLQPVLTQRLGREKYLDAISQLRQHPFVRDFEVSSRDASSIGGLPEVFFDSLFVDFLKDNFSRLSRAVDRDPNLEIHQSHEGIDRDLVDSLRGQIDEKNQALEKIQSDLLTMEQKVNQEQADHRRTQESSITQLNTIKRINEDLHTNHDTEMKKLERAHRQAMLDLENRLNLQVTALNNKVQQTEKDKASAIAKTKQEYDEILQEAKRARTELERRLNTITQSHQEALDTIRSLQESQHATNSEMTSLQNTIASLNTSLQPSGTEMKKLKGEIDTLSTQLNTLKSANQDLKAKAQDQTWKVKDMEEKLRKANASAKEKEEARASAQTELDDLLLILSDLEEKRTRDKVSYLLNYLDGAARSRLLTFESRNDLRNWARRFRMRRMRRRMRRRVVMKMKMKMKRMKMRRSRLHMLYMPLIKQASPVFPVRTAIFSCERIVTWGLLRMV